MIRILENDLYILAAPDYVEWLKEEYRPDWLPLINLSNHLFTFLFFFFFVISSLLDQVMIIEFLLCQLNIS